MKRWRGARPEPALHPVVDQRPHIDVMELRRLDAFGDGTKHFPVWGLAADRARIVWRAPSWPQDRPSTVFRVQWARCQFGGFRPWIICACDRRVARLYYSRKFDYLGCRTCLGLRYLTQRKTAVGRAILRAKKLRIRLCDGGYSVPAVDPIPPRPPNMRRATFERIAAELDAIERSLPRRGAIRQAPHGL